MAKTNKTIYGSVKRKKKVQAQNLKRARQVKREKKTVRECKDPVNYTCLESSNPIPVIADNVQEMANIELNTKTINTNQASSSSSIVKNTTDNSTNEMDICIEKDLTLTEQVITEAPIRVEGRRVVEFQYVIDQLKAISKHSQKFGCQLDFLQVVKEKSHELMSTFKMRCSMCRSTFDLKTCDDDESVSDVNHSAVSGLILIGCGLSNFNELAASMNLPTLNNSQYSKCHQNLYDWWKITAETTMNVAAAEEIEKATEKSANGNAKISVTADACWSKRSYKSNYSSLAGVGAIIGVNSGKVLHIGIKNKYCVICMRAQNKGKNLLTHKCNVNHTGSSTSMEQAAIVEGFKKSEEEHNLIYSKLIADGDASTYKNILESRPYPNVTVQKIECSNHLMRNYNGKNLMLTKDTAIPLNQRKLLTVDRIKRLRIAVKAAVRFRKAQNYPFTEQVQKLQRDILNSPKHVFGNHSKCEDYYCSLEKKLEPNNVPNVTALMTKLMANTSALANHAQSLIYNLNNNRAEQFNAIVAKCVGGKRINYALKNSYALRCYAAVVAFNTGTPIYTLHKTIVSKSPSVAVKKFENLKLRKNKKKKFWKPKRRINMTNENADYGESCQKPDKTDDEYETAKMLYLENLKTQVEEKDVIERDTVLQAESALWLELRRCLLTASNFAKVCKRRSNISSAPLVKTLLYSYSLDHVPAIQHGKINEAAALKQLARQENIEIKKCGLFIDSTHFFLGASPDAVFNDGIVEIKCPKSAFGLNPDDAITQKKIRMWKIAGNNIVLNKSYDWYYQVQGQLHITNKDKCLFAVWTGPEHPLKTEIIERDDEFWANSMEQKLVDFYYKCMLPEILDSRKARSMPLRDTVL